MVDIAADASTTASITVGATISDSLEVVGDHDWFRLNLVNGQAVTVLIHGVTLDDTYLRIYDQSGTMVYEADDISYTNKDSRLSFAASYTGAYYIDVGSWDDRTAGTYQVSVSNYVTPGVASLQGVADQLKVGYWGAQDAHHFNVTSGGFLTVNLTGLTADGQTLARAALQTWTDVIGITFREVSSGGQIVFDDSDTGAATSGSWSNGIATSANVNVGTEWLTKYGTSLTSYSFQTYIHEIGHALGLGHAGDYNGDGRYPYDAVFSNDGWPETVMSYFDQNESAYFSDQGFTRNYIATPMMADVLAATQLYGMSTTTRVGDTTYGPSWTSSMGAICLVDSAGNDTIDVSSYSFAQTVDLRPATFSNVLGETGNVSIAPGTTIENAKTGAGADTIIGNDVANVITGGAGRDTLTGGGGNDIFKDTAAGHNGDTIVDFSRGDSIVFTDAGSNFSFSLSGNTLSYTGGSLTFANMPTGTLAAAAAAGGGVQISLAGAAGAAGHAVAGDIDGDGRSDLAIGSTAGAVINWLALPGGNFFSNQANASYVVPSGWHVAGNDDFNGDGHSDLLLRSDGGLITTWLGQSNGTFNTSAAPTEAVGSSWHVYGTGDFNGDGQADVLMRNDNGTIVDWLGKADGSFVSNSAVANYALPTNWLPAASGDFNGDGRSDIILRTSDGSLVEWLGQANGSFAYQSTASTSLPSSWVVEGAGDISGDGRADLILRNSSGVITEWLGSASGVFAPVSANYALDPAYKVAQVGDYNGDGRADIVLRNSAGTLIEWLGQSDGSFAWNSNAVYAVGSDWTVQPSLHTIF